MRSKIVIFIVFIGLLFSCQVIFDKNIRVETNGIIVDENGVAIPDIPVFISTKSSLVGFFSPLGDNVLGQTITDSNGQFSITSLYDSDFDFFITVNGGESYTSYIYSANSFLFLTEDYNFNLGELSLKQLAEVDVNITRSSPPGTTLDFDLEYENPRCVENFIDGNLDEDNSSCFENFTTSDNLDDANPNFNTSVSSFISGTIQFNYSINGAPEVTEIYIINDENYEINFAY